MNDIVTQRIPRIMMATILAFVITVQPMVQAKKAEAIAPVVGAGAAAAALAAELGITTETLMAGVAVITAAGTGIYLMQSSDYSTSAVALDDNLWRNLWNGNDVTGDYPINNDEAYRKYKLGNGKSWDDLSDSEKETYGTAAGYVQSGLLGYALELGLLEQYGDGGFQPTPEPDPEQEPEEHSRWQKSRNVLTTLGVAGAAVALNDAVGWLGDTVGNGIHDLIFGTGDVGLGIPFSQSFDINERSIAFTNVNGASYNNVSINGNEWALYRIRDSNHVGGAYSMYMIYASVNANPVITLRPSSLSNGYKGFTGYIPANCKTVGWNQSGTPDNSITYTSDVTLQIPSRDSYAISYLNSSFSGTYVFTDANGNEVARFNNGDMTGTYNENFDYQSMQGTPEELTDSMGNNTNWNKYINNVSIPNENGQVQAVSIPQLTGTTTYPDIVKLTDASNVTPIPDDKPVPTPDPKPEPGYSPNVPENWNNDVEETVDRIMKNPLDQLFPFCLIADLRDFTFLLLGGEEYANKTNRLQPGTISIQSDAPLEELNGVHALTLDFREAFDGFYVEIPLDPVHDLLHYTRTTVTVVLIMAIVIGSFSFFLKRGGE